MSLLLAVTVGGLFAAGFYLLLRRNLLRLVFGIALLGQAVNLLIFAGGGPERGAPPLVPQGGDRTAVRRGRSFAAGLDPDGHRHRLRPAGLRPGPVAAHQAGDAVDDTDSLREEGPRAPAAEEDPMSPLVLPLAAAAADGGDSGFAAPAAALAAADQSGRGGAAGGGRHLAADCAYTARGFWRCRWGAGPRPSALPWRRIFSAPCWWR